MGRKKKALPLWEGVTISDVAAEGKALARVGEMVVFVPYVVPGDVVDLQARRVRRNYAEAEAVKFHALSPERAEAFCPHFGVCGGCKWQILPYEAQLRYKQRQVADALSRIAKVELPEISPILGSRQTREYRNKLEFSFSNRRWLTREQVESGEPVTDRDALGFHIPGAFDKILDIRECHLMGELNNRVRNFIRRDAHEHGLTFCDIRAGSGLLRSMMLRTSSTGEAMLVVQARVGTPAEREALLGLLGRVRDAFPQLTSLLWADNHKGNDTLEGLDIHTFAGTDAIYEQMEGLRFKVGPKSFYQTNSEQAYELYKVARRFAGLTGQELVYDLYTGTGTIANFVARQARQVIGIEYVPEAIDDARANSALNSIGNTLFFAGDMKDILSPEFVQSHGQPDVVITDPPRAGMHPDVVRTLLMAAPSRIVYVSCNPATQARDVALLDAAYRVAAVQPVDMFPQTHHVENVLLLLRR